MKKERNSRKPIILDDDMSVESSTRSGSASNVLDEAATEVSLMDLSISIAKGEMVNRIYNDAVRRQLTTLIMSTVQQEIRNGYWDTPVYNFSAMQIERDGRSTRGSDKFVKATHWAITLSLPDEADKVHQISEINRKIKKLKFLPSGTKWVIEQRGDSDLTMGSGMHVHIVSPKYLTKPKSEIVRDLSRSLGLASNFVNVLARKYDEAIKYITEPKGTLEKRQKQVYDIKMRQLYGFLDIYEK